MTDNETAEAPGQPPAGQDSRPLPWLRAVSSGNLEYDRVLFFSDAIFAIAITLLVVDIRVPGPTVSHINSARLLLNAVPQMVGFGISFAVIGMFWVGHHGIFRHIVAMDRPLMWLNLLFAGTIAFLPYPTSLLSVAGNQTPAIVFYAVWVSLAGLAEAALWVYACRVPGLLREDTPATLRRYFTVRMLRAPVIFLLSIPVAFAWPAVAPYTWLAVAAMGFALRRAAARQHRANGRRNRAVRLTFFHRPGR